MVQYCFCTSSELNTSDNRRIFIQILSIPLKRSSDDVINIECCLREKSLRQTSTMRLVLLLVVTNFLLAITTIPYSIYLTVSWDPVYINLNPYIIIISGAPFIFQLKVDLTLTISLAMERIMVRHCTMIISIFYSLTQLIKIFQALFFPVAFRRLSSSSYPTCCLLLVDLLNITQLYVDGISIIQVMGIVVIILTISIAVKLRLIGQKSQSNGVVNFKENKFKQANRICAGILIISLMCVTMPSLIVAITEMLITSTFGVFGPFYIAGLLCAGDIAS
ncbi:hypothetical protein DICVIV_03644 [Dictyocaulus viviparus]|uniref:Uncharacterized protein n=1 Tax=Dictyocaulus viviparus TaxID=29172 RepID=A0A0D8Y0K1_DICVI|nr:hypothetical protein DICVIV_03644 [Dictyocaulus viviparus]